MLRMLLRGGDADTDTDADADSDCLGEPEVTLSFDDEVRGLDAQDGYLYVIAGDTMFDLGYKPGEYVAVVDATGEEFDVVSGINDPIKGCFHLDVDSSRIYMASEEDIAGSDPSFRAFSVSNPNSDPTSVFKYSTSPFHGLRVLVRDDVAFLAGRTYQGSSYDCELRIYDVSGELAVSLDELSLGTGEPWALAKTEGYAFVGKKEDNFNETGSVSVIDVTDTASIQAYTDQASFDGTVFSLAVSQGKLYVGSGDRDDSACEDCRLTVFSLGNLPALEKEGAVVLSDVPLSLLVDDEIVYIGSEFGGCAYDVSDLSSPKKLGESENYRRFATDPSNDEYIYAAGWSSVAKFKRCD